MLRGDNEKVVFQMKRMMKYSSDEAFAYSCFKLDVVGELAKKYKFDKIVGDTIERCITQSGTVEDENPEKKKEAEALETGDQVVDEEELKEEASRLSVELKVLPTHLKYAFLETNNFSMIISAYMTGTQEQKLVELLKNKEGQIPTSLYLSNARESGWTWMLLLLGWDCLKNFELVLERCEATHLVLNWEKCHFMVKEGIVMGYKVTAHGIEVDRAMIDVIARLPPPTSVKSIKSFLGHAGFYRRFIKNLSSIAKPLTALLAKDVKYVFTVECLRAFTLIK
nr:uncharacterized protein LOC104104279 [Nicotiana tomentosiformis]